MAQAVEPLPNKHETLSSSPTTAKKKKSIYLNRSHFHLDLYVLIKFPATLKR
jgi:hypothetical protein